MREAHCHLAAFGEALTLPNLDDCASVSECLDLVRRFASTSPAPNASPWIRLKGARIEAWAERRWPTRRELDDAAGERPVVIMSFDHHAAAANSSAMLAGNVRAGVPVPPNGVVEVDPTTGEATGLLLEQAFHAVWSAAPAPSTAERESHVLAALERYRSLGFDEVHDLLSQDWLGEILAGLERSGRIPLSRVLLYPPIERLAEALSGRAAWESDRLRLAGGKVFCDGTLNSRTALVLEPYAEPLPGMPRGMATISESALDRALAETRRHGLHLAVHAIGDGAVRMVLDAIERAPTLKPGSPPHRIEHCEIIDARDVPRFARLGVVCSVQPCHLLTDIEVLTRQTPDRLNHVLPLRDLIAAGCAPGELLWFGSDAPIVRPDAADSVQAAVHRRRAGMSENQAIASNQAISPDQAWACFAR